METIAPVVLGRQYVAPQNDRVRVRFTSLPASPGKLRINEVHLTAEQVRLSGALSDIAYDITSTMADGSFSYDLTLPLPEPARSKPIESIGVKSASSAGTLQNAQTVTQPKEKAPDTITIRGLNHFTIFVVTAPPSVQNDCSDAGFPVSVGDHCFNSIQAAIAAASDGDTIEVKAGNYTESGQIVIDKNLTITGADKTTTTIKPAGNTGGSGDARGWFLVNSGKAFNLSKVTLDGQGKNVAVGILTKGTGTISDSVIKNITSPGYMGLGVKIESSAAPAASANVTVNGVTLQNIGRVGLHAGATGTILTVTNISYTGKGAVDGLDYGVEVGWGAHATVTGSTFSDCRGTASDGSTSSGVYASTYFGPGTEATFNNNTFVNNYAGITVGYDVADTSIVVAHNNDFNGNGGKGVETTAPTVNATDNWWGSATGPTHASNVSYNSTTARGVAVSNSVTFVPWLNAAPTAAGVSFSPVTNAAGGNYAAIQAAVDAAGPGATINVKAGSYSETATIEKSLTLAGAGKTQTTLKPATLLATGIGHKYDANMKVAMLVNNASSVTVRDMTIDGNGLDANAVVFWNASSGTLQNLKITNPRPLSGVQTGQGLAVDAKAPNVTSLQVNNCDFEKWNKNGIDVVDGNGAATGGGNITVAVSGGTFTGQGDTTTIAQNGIVFLERAGGTINGSVSNASFSSINYTPDTNNAAAILLYALANGQISPISGCSFTNTESYIALASGSNKNVLATGNTFDGVAGDSATLAQLFAVEDKIVHKLDDPTLGLVQVRPNNLYVTSQSGSIQRAVDAASDNDTINVSGGSYTEQLDINKNLTINGVGAGSTTIKAPAVMASKYMTGGNQERPVVYMHGTSAVTIKQLTVDGSSSGDTNARLQGIAFVNAGGTVDRVTVTNIRDSDPSLFGMQRGVGIVARNLDGAARTVTISNSTINSYQKNGMALAGAGLSVNVTGNTVTGCGENEVIAQNGIQVSGGAAGTVSNNTVTNNAYKGTAGGQVDPATNSADGAAGILLYASGGTVEIRNNTITGNQFGVWSVASNGVNIHDNTITGPDPSTIGLSSPVGVMIWSDDGGNGDAGTTGTANANTISTHKYGLLVRDWAAGGISPSISATNNSITGASGFGAWTNVPLTATDNWWGHLSGPTHASNAGGTGIAVSDNVTFSPWLSSGIDADAVTPGFQPAAGPKYGIPTRLAFTTQPTGANAGSQLGTQPEVRAQDAGGNLGINYTGTVTLAIGANPNGGTLSGTLSRAASGGVATFSGLSINNGGDGYGLMASATGLTSATSGGFNISNPPSDGGGDSGSGGGGTPVPTSEPTPVPPTSGGTPGPTPGGTPAPQGTPTPTGGLPPEVGAPAVGQTSGQLVTTNVGTTGSTTVTTTNTQVGVTVPAGGASQSVVASYQSVVQSSAPPAQGSIQMGSTVFQLEFRDPITNVKVPTTAEVTITYTESDMAAAGGSTAGLGIAIFDGTNWVTLPCTVNTTTHTITTTTIIDATFALIAAPPVAPDARQDYSIQNGWYFAQANGLGGAGSVGYTVTDSDDVPFWTEFQRLGGVAVVGYPVTQRFKYDGFVTQAFQKMVFQWRPESKSVAFVNVFDELSRTGQDGWLERSRQTPPAFDTSEDTGLSFDQVMARHLAMLEQNPAIQTAFVGTQDWLSRYGLPVSCADFGNVFVVRAQRAVFQQWKVEVPWAAAGDVLVANGGDLGKEAGLWPLAATAPLPAPKATTAH